MIDIFVILSLSSNLLQFEETSMCRMVRIYSYVWREENIYKAKGKKPPELAERKGNKRENRQRPQVFNFNFFFFLNGEQGRAISHLCEVRRDGVQHAIVSRTGAGLKGEHVVGPPWTSSPPQSTSPDISVLSHGIQKTSDSSLADIVGSTGEFTKDTGFVVLTEPVGGALNTFGSDGAADALRSCT